MIRKHKKIRLALAALIAMTFLSSCGVEQGADTPSVDEATTASEQTAQDLSVFHGTWEMKNSYNTMQNGYEEFTYQLDIFEDGKITLSSTSAHFYGAELGKSEFSDSGELKVVIPYSIPSQAIYVPLGHENTYKINLSLKPENGTLVGKSVQAVSDSQITLENISHTPRLYEEIDKLTVEQMKEDLDVVFDILENKHPNAFYTQPKEKYEEKKAELLAKLDTLDKTSFFYETKRLVASIMDSHTAVAPSDSAFEMFEKIPIGIEYFSGKWHITSANPEYEQLLGKELTAINDIPIAEVFERVSTMKGHENEAFKQKSFQRSFDYIGLLNFLGIAKGNNVTFTLDNTEKVEIAAIKSKDIKADCIVTFGKKAPTAMQKDKYYFWQKLGDDIFYIQYNACMESTPPLAEFGVEVKTQLSEHSYKKIVIDLRNNGGGNSNFINHFYEPIINAQKNGAKIYALISGDTFSAAFNNAITMQKDGVTLVGQPTGGNMQQFTEVNFFDLPNSRIIGQFSTKFQDYDPTKPYDSLYPDVQIDHTLNAYINGIDEEIEYIKAD